MINLEKIRHIKTKHEKELLGKPNVVGVGIGKKNMTDELCIKVYVITKKPESQLKPDEIIPKLIEGVKTDIVESGKIHFQNAVQ